MSAAVLQHAQESPGEKSSLRRHRQRQVIDLSGQPGDAGRWQVDLTQRNFFAWREPVTSMRFVRHGAGSLARYTGS